MPSESIAVWGTCVLAALALAAALSGWITRHQHRREARHLQAVQLAEALARHAAWVASQRRNATFVLNEDVAEAALRQASQIQARAFPDLAREWAAVRDVHARLLAFLASQQRLRLADPEAWLESDHDARFLALWHEHQQVLEALTRRLEGAMRGAPVDRPEPGSA